MPVAPFKGGADTEFEVQAYLDAMTDRARGLAPEFPGDPQDLPQRSVASQRGQQGVRGQQRRQSLGLVGAAQ